MKYVNYSWNAKFTVIPKSKPKLLEIRSLCSLLILFMSIISYAQAPCNSMPTQECFNMASFETPPVALDVSSLVCDGDESGSIVVAAGGLYTITIAEGNSYSFSLVPSGNNLSDPIFPGKMDLFHDQTQLDIAASSGPVSASAGTTPTNMTYIDNSTEDNVLYLAVWDKSCAGNWKDYSLSVTCTSCAITCADRQVIAANESGCISAASAFPVPTTTGPCDASTLNISNDGGTGATITGNMVSVPAGLAADIYSVEFTVMNCSGITSTCTTELVVEPTSGCNSPNINLTSVCNTPLTANMFLTNLCGGNEQYTLYINGVASSSVSEAGTYNISVRYTPTMDGTAATGPNTTNPFFNKELCWKAVLIEDKNGPTCNLPQADREYNFVCGFEGATASPTFFDCSGDGNIVENPVQETLIGDCGEIAGITNGNNDLIDDFDPVTMTLTFMGMSIPAPSEDEATTLSNGGFALERIEKRTFSASDGQNTGNTCDQFIYIWRPTDILAPGKALLSCGFATTPSALVAEDPKLVPYYANPLYDVDNDNSGSNDFMKTNIVDPTFVSTRVDDNGNPEFVGIAGQDHSVCKFIVNNVDGPESTPCGNTIKFIRRYTVTNCCTDEIIIDNASQLVETRDDIEPVFSNCPSGNAVGTITNPDTVRITSSTSCSATVDFLSLGLLATDGCSEPLSYNASFFDTGAITTGTGTLVATGTSPLLPKGNYRVEVTATDGCNNTSAPCNYFVNVDDTVVPTLQCHGTGISIDGNGNAEVCASDNATPKDNCSIITSLQVRKMEDDDSAFDDCIFINCTDATMDANGSLSIVLVYRAIDACGNSNISMCTSEVQIKTAPNFSCPPNVTVECTEYDALGDINGVGPTIGGNCGTMFSTRFENGPFMSGVCDGSGTIIRTYFLVQNGADIASCTQTITIEDNTPPTFDQMFPMDITAECSAIPDGTEITATDSCPEGNMAVVTFTDMRADGNCTDNYTITRTFIATDDCGNSVSGIQTIEVSDNTSPTFINTPMDITVSCNNIPVTSTIPAEDNCDDDVLVEVSDGPPVTDMCPNNNSFVRTFIATDNCGNSTVVMQSITVQNIPIQVTAAPDQTLVCSEMDGFMFTPPTVIDSPCASTNPVTSEVVIETSEPDAMGNIVQVGTFTVTDDCGISASAVTTITFTSCCPVVTIQRDIITCSAFSGTVTIDPFTTYSGNLNDLTFRLIDDQGTQIGMDQIGNDVFTFMPAALDGTEYTSQVFFTDPNLAATCPGDEAEPVSCAANRIAGRIYNEEFISIEDVEVELMDTEIPMSMTNVEGTYNFENLEDQGYTIAAHKEEDPANGISTFDLVLMAQHVLQINDLNTPYKLIAADVNMDQTIDILDMIELRQLILFAIDDFSVNQAWRFVNADYVFPDPKNPWLEAIPQTHSIETLSADTEVDFIAVKIGDLDCSAQTKSSVTTVTERAAQPLVLQTSNAAISAGTKFSVSLSTQEDFTLSAAQFTLNFDPNLAAFEGIQSQALSLNEGAVSQKFAQEGLLPFAWYTTKGVDFTESTDIVFNFTAKQDLTIADLLQLNSTLTEAKAYTPMGEQYNVELNILEETTTLVPTTFKVYQNQPNPFSSQTVIGYEMPTAQAVLLTVFDLDGKVIFTRNLDAAAGYNSVELTSAQINKSGVLYFQLNTADYSVTKKMIILE